MCQSFSQIMGVAGFRGPWVSKLFGEHRGMWVSKVFAGCACCGCQCHTRDPVVTSFRRMCVHSMCQNNSCNVGSMSKCFAERSGPCGCQRCMRDSVVTSVRRMCLRSMSNVFAQRACSCAKNCRCCAGSCGCQSVSHDDVGLFSQIPGRM